MNQSSLRFCVCANTYTQVCPRQTGIHTCRGGIRSTLLSYWSLPLKELAEWLEIGPLQPRTHIWNGDTMLCYLNFLAGEIRERRRRYNLPHSARCLILCDQASQHTTKKYELLRKNWCHQHNVAPWLRINKIFLYMCNGTCGTSIYNIMWFIWMWYNVIECVCGCIVGTHAWRDIAGWKL